MDSPEGSANDAMNAEIDRRINEAVNASIRPLQDQMAQQTAQMTQLLTALNGLMSPDRATPTPLTSSVPTPSTADTTIQAPSDDTVMVAEGRRKPLPNPPKFTGRRKDYPAWSQQMRDKTTLDAGLMGGNAEVWYYINSRLDVDPQQVVATFYAAGGPGGERDPSEFMRYLDRTYKDPSAASRAAATLRTIRQRDDQSLASFLPRYERVLSEAGGASWADQAKITLLEGALSTRLQRALVTVDLPVDNYHGWLMRVQDVAARLERLPATTRRSSSYYPRAPEASRHHDNDGDVVMTGVSRARNKKGAPEPQRRRRYSSSSESEGSEQPQKDSRRCYNCNNIGHIATRCTKPKRPGPKKIKKVKKAKKSEESSNDSATEELGSSEAEESSGKDDIIEWKQFKHRMSSKSAVITARIHKGTQADALVDTGCDLYALVDHDLARRLRLPIVDRSERILGSFSDATGATKATGVVVFNLELCGYDEKIFAYTVRGLGDDLFLGKPWMERNCVVYDASAQQIRHRRGGVDLRLKGEEEPERIRQIRTARLLPGAPFTTLYKRAQRQTGETAAYEVRAISLADIQKALAKKTEKADLKALLPPAVLAEFRELFQPDEAANLPPHRPGVDHEIPIKQDSKGNEAVLPWGPLYGMSREELLVLRKTLRDLLDKGFIRASSSEASAPVLFVRKPGGGIRFCVDYRALNELTKRDRYPLPLIRETLRTISAARWFTKLDVVAAFHKIRIAEGEEHKTAFRTRYGLFEWLVVPFGLTGAPATFQRYINGVLREYLDDFATAYMDDVLIYSNGSQKDHEAKVRLVLRKLADAGLRLDPHKCAFSVKTVKYLGFIVTAGIGISCDPEKLRAIKEWAAPKTVKGVRSFLGFANYYRIFIPAYSNIAGPLIALTKKGAPFCWGKEQEAAFQELKRIFAAKPVLHQLDPELTTYVEADCSGFALGGVLSQEDEHGRRHAVAYHSQRLNAAQFNYPIHDKEMLAIMSCLREWRAELQSVESFKILSDHRNLKYFMQKQKLTERQSRWAEELSQYNFEIQYRPGSEAVVPDALSRREQDVPTSLEDEREQGRILQLLPEVALPSTRTRRVEVAPAMLVFTDDKELQQLWDQTQAGDEVYQRAYTAVKQRERSFPPSLKLKVQIAECEIDNGNRLLFRDRIWVPGSEDLDREANTLRTRIVQSIHDSVLSGHPGRDNTLALVSRRFYWPGQSQLVRRFCRNCDGCGRSHIWRERRKGLLKPLPIPQRIRSDLAMDFITDLPPTDKNERFLWVIIDRLGKGVTLEAMQSMEAEACAERFLSCHFRFHGVPTSIVSDRGSNWTSRFWRQFCKLLGIEQRLSTAYHPQTDGGPERMNQEIQAYLRNYVTYSQKDWACNLPAAQLALCSRDNSAIGMSSFFLEHGYNPEPIKVKEADPASSEGTREGQARKLVTRLQDVMDMAQSTLASTQQRYEELANRKRQPTERLEVGDKVWLHMGHYRSPRPCKKLDWLHHKYTVTKVISPYVVELDVPAAIYPRFHVDILKRADDEGEETWSVESIDAATWKRRGRGRRREVLVKWEGYTERTWEPVETLQGTEAMEAYERRYGSAMEHDGDPALAPRARRRRGAGG
ncbi:Transposon Tf2-6 polyprotein [Colletotrichum fructicola Nara gc5]|uniref:RNA-directed DNA polymerase n=1 Tax=Colletotrichum fructicola (strain Nara gc5) TaxID=1213859 RepID=A0A7J6IL58_COLFN|nr:Transposon Tf2-6 polyprotein [Colletotrichum fructicola Nara gc5]